MSNAIIKEAPAAKAFWLSWYNVQSIETFELHRPWWISGYRDSDDAETVCAAIIAPDEKRAKALILAAYDKPPKSVEWRFCEERPNDWTPFNDRFQRADWMRWPDGKAERSMESAEARSAVANSKPVVKEDSE